MAVFGVPAKQCNSIFRQIFTHIPWSYLNISMFRIKKIRFKPALLRVTEVDNTCCFSSISHTFFNSV